MAGLRRRAGAAARLLRNLTLDPLAGLVPRSPRRWAFGYTGDGFADNPRALFLWVRLNRPDIDARWISGSPRTVALLRRAGHPAHLRWSPAGMVAAARARVWVFAHGIDNVNAGLSRGAFLVNLWHGVGLKTVHRGHAGGNTAAAARRARGWAGRALGIEYLRPYDLVATTSDAMQAHFAAQFALPPARCPQIGYPRHDTAVDPALAAASLAVDALQGFRWPDGFREHYVYLPTYRDTGRSFLDEAIPDPARLSAALAARDALMWIKPHPRTPPPSTRLPDNIRPWPAEVDVNAWLPRFDGLVTDYSSVLYDRLRRRPAGIVLYTFDLDRYLAHDRALALPFDENVAGLRVADFDALCRAIRDGAALRPADPAAVTRLDALFWGGAPDPASPAVVAAIGRHVGSTAASPASSRGAGPRTA